MQFQLDGQGIHHVDGIDLRQYLERVREQQFSEVWLNFGEEGPSMMMLVNGVHAWLMYLQDHDDPGFHSLNPSYHGPVEQMMKFELSNGQMDEYPVAWTLTLEEAFRACEYFVITQGGRSPAITWQDS